MWIYRATTNEPFELLQCYICVELTDTDKQFVGSFGYQLTILIIRVACGNLTPRL